MRFLLVFFLTASLLSAAESASAQLLRWMDATAQKQLSARRDKIQAIRTPEQARMRQEEVRAKLERLFGPDPSARPPLDPHVTGTLHEGTYTIEKLYFTSLPGVFITANLYLPRTPGKHPAVLFSLGHWDVGKPAGQTIAANLASKGFVVLAYDPTGQGERLQASDPRTGNSLLGGSTEQHFAAGAQALLTGQTLARYMLHDSQRALDYLVSRPEVDADQIGAAGCSGGGTQTTYLAALDPRIKVAAPACYMNSFQVLYSGAVGDPEQTLPNFLAEGLDQADYVELFAPKPWLISSTEKDFFTPAGAKIVYEEARQWYRVLGHEERIKWVVGPGGHGTPREVREAIYDWMIRWLKDGKGSSKEEPVNLHSDGELLVLPGTQSMQLPGAKDLSTVIVGGRMPASASYTYATESSVRIDTVSTKEENRIQTVELRLNLGGLDLPATLRIPAGAKNAAAILLVQQSAPQNETALKLASQGAVVMQFWPRGLPSDFVTNGRLSGDWITPLRAALIGRNLAADRAVDILRAAKILAERPEVDPSHVRAWAAGTSGIWLLHAAANGRFERIWLDRTPASLERALQSEVIRDAFDGLTPGGVFAPDLAAVRAVATQRKTRVLWTDPSDWMRNVIPNLPGGYQYRAFEGSDEPYWDFLLR